MPDMIHCLNCKRLVSENAVDRKLMTAFCARCQHVFKITQEIKQPAGTENIRFRIRRNELEIRIYWERNKYPSFKGFPYRNKLISILTNFLSKFITQSTISVNSKLFTIDSNPDHNLPITYYQVSYIKALKVKKRPRVLIEEEWIENGYGLYAVVHSGSEALLLWDLNIPTLLYIEQEITRVLRHNAALHN